MAGVGQVDIVIFILGCLFFSLADGELCGYYHSLWDNGLMNCEYGCCGDYGNQECCIPLPNIGAIVGGAIGGVCALIGLITLIVCCTKKQHRGQVVTVPAHVVTVSQGVTHPTNYHTQGVTHPTNYPMAPPPRPYTTGPPAVPPTGPATYTAQGSFDNPVPAPPLVFPVQQSGAEPMKTDLGMYPPTS